MGIYSRRTIWRALIATPFVGLVEARSLQAAGAGDAAITTPEKWMSVWMGGRRAVRGPLHIGRFKDPMYYLLRPISWYPGPESDMQKVIVPKGFVTDFASIPQLFWSLLRPDGEYTYPAVIHDFLYWAQDRPREAADKVFLQAMMEFKIDTATAHLIHGAVRAGGQVAWDNNAKIKSMGEKRVLRNFPENPLISWAEWKKVPTRFA